MSKPSCRDKVSYYSEEEIRSFPAHGTAIYLCPRCQKFHSTSQKSTNNLKRWQHERRRRKTVPVGRRRDAQAPPFPTSSEKPPATERSCGISGARMVPG